MKTKELQILNGISNNVTQEMPYSVLVEITGSCPLLFHRWDCESIESKSKAKKGSNEKKTDNIESYVYRDEDGDICLPGEYLRMSMVFAAKYKQDPRSPRKSAFDLCKAGLICLTEHAKINGGVKEWDFLHKSRVVIQRNGITRTRPAFMKGWTSEFIFSINIPEYIDFQFFNEILQIAGRSNGVGDFRPTYGRFDVTRCQKLMP